MPYNRNPQAFFGPGYSEASGAITLKTSEAAGVTTGTTFQGEADNDRLTFASAHNLKVGDRVQVTQGTTLPTGLAAATDYFVKEVVSATVITLCATKNGPVIDLTTDGSADNTCQAFGPLEELTEDEIDATTGDWKRILFGFFEMLYQKWINTPTADRSSKITFTRSSSIDPTTGEETRYYSASIKLTPITVEVSEE